MNQTLWVDFIKKRKNIEEVPTKDEFMYGVKTGL